MKLPGFFPCSAEGIENYQQTSKTNVDVAADISMNWNEEEISIKHRLPSKFEIKTIIATFVRRVTKFDFMKKKKTGLNETLTKTSKY